MCGLVAYITHKDAKLKPWQKELRSRIFTGLGCEMEIRGKDSSGIAGAFGENKAWTFKNAVKFSELMNLKGYKEIMFDNTPYMAMGHTRWKTTGAITHENAHPFVKGNIIGIHNGHVTNWRAINNKVNVDSEVIFELLNSTNNNPIEAFKQLYGMFAIIWWDKRNLDRMYFVKEDNPLSVAFVPQLNTYFLCSLEQSMINTFIPSVGLDGVEFLDLEKNVVYEMDNLFNIQQTKVEFKSWQSDYNSYDSRNDTTYKSTKDFEDRKYKHHKKKKCKWPSSCPQHGFKSACSTTNNTPELPASCYVGRRDKYTPLPDLDVISRAIAFSQLSLSDELYIYQAVVANECGFCTGTLGVDKGIWWHTTEKIVYCPDCLKNVTEPKALAWLDNEQYKKIREDIDDAYDMGKITDAELYPYSDVELFDPKEPEDKLYE